MVNLFIDDNEVNVDWALMGKYLFFGLNLGDDRVIFVIFVLRIFNLWDWV